jgi:hypothetical protein
VFTAFGENAGFETIRTKAVCVIEQVANLRLRAAETSVELCCGSYITK